MLCLTMFQIRCRQCAPFSTIHGPPTDSDECTGQSQAVSLTATTMVAIPLIRFSPSVNLRRLLKRNGLHLHDSLQAVNVHRYRQNLACVSPGLECPPMESAKMIMLLRLICGAHICGNQSLSTTRMHLMGQTVQPPLQLALFKRLLDYRLEKDIS